MNLTRLGLAIGLCALASLPISANMLYESRSEIVMLDGWKVHSFDLLGSIPQSTFENWTFLGEQSTMDWIVPTALPSESTFAPSTESSADPIPLLCLEPCSTAASAGMNNDLI